MRLNFVGIAQGLAPLIFWSAKRNPDPFFNQFGKLAAVVKMGMGRGNGINIGQVEALYFMLITLVRKLP